MISPRPLAVGIICSSALSAILSGCTHNATKLDPVLYEALPSSCAEIAEYAEVATQSFAGPLYDPDFRYEGSDLFVPNLADTKSCDIFFVSKAQSWDDPGPTGPRQRMIIIYFMLSIADNAISAAQENLKDNRQGFGVALPGVGDEAYTTTKSRSESVESEVNFRSENLVVTVTASGKDFSDNSGSRDLTASTKEAAEAIARSLSDNMQGIMPR